jgi:hypothetical protein
MRIWSLHPRYLDTKGLVALWRETLLAQKVLQGLTKGYTKHPQLDRFRAHSAPVAAVAEYLRVVHAEATRRGFSFDATRICEARFAPESSNEARQLSVTEGQLAYEWRHLKAKLAIRAPAVLETHEGVEQPDAHCLFVVVEGGIASWERP